MRRAIATRFDLAQGSHQATCTKKKKKKETWQFTAKIILVFQDYDGVTKKFDIPPNNSSFIEFAKLYAALPFCWKDNKNYQLPDNHDHLSSFRSALNNITCSTKWVYICLREFNIVEPIKQHELWSKVLNIQSVINWGRIYKTNYLCTIETKLRSFQIKLNLRMIVTNNQLFGFGLIESQNCKFSNKAPETLLHLFCTCPVVVIYWENVSACISSFLKDSLNNTEHNIYLFNCLLLCARFVTYKCKYGNRILTALEFYQQVQKLNTSEYILSKNRSKINLFRKKWSIVL